MALLKLYIKCNDSYPISDFILLGLLPKCRQIFNEKLSKGKCAYIEPFIKGRLDLGKFSLYEVLQMAVDCLYLKTDDKNGYEISMDTAECIPGTHTPLESVASMVEFGDIGVPKYPIFSSTFKEIRKCYALFKDEYMGVY